MSIHTKPSRFLMSATVTCKLCLKVNLLNKSTNSINAIISLKKKKKSRRFLICSYETK